MRTWTMGIAVVFAFLVASTASDQPDYAKIAALTEGISKGDINAMLAAGNSGSSIYLDPLTKFVRKAEYAELALAKLGDKTAFAKIVAETESPDPMTAKNAVDYKLPYIGGPKSIRILAQIILNPKFDTAPPGSGDVVYLPLGDYALKAFVSLVPEVPVARALAQGNPVFLATKRAEIRTWIREHPKYWK